MGAQPRGFAVGVGGLFLAGPPAPLGRDTNCSVDV